MDNPTKIVNQNTAKMVATAMIPLILFGLSCIGVSFYLVNNVYTGI